MELGCAFYLASDGVSCSHGGGDVICTLDHFRERPLEYIYALLMLGCGFGAGMILGFMATIYVSGERVYITLYFIMLFVTMFCIYRMADAVEEKIKQTGGKLAVTLLVLICLVNVGFVTLSC